MVSIWEFVWIRLHLDSVFSCRYSLAGLREFSFLIVPLRTSRNRIENGYRIYNYNIHITSVRHTMQKESPPKPPSSSTRAPPLPRHLLPLNLPPFRLPNRSHHVKKEYEEEQRPYSTQHSRHAHHAKHHEPKATLQESIVLLQRIDAGADLHGSQHQREEDEHDEDP